MVIVLIGIVLRWFTFSPSESDTSATLFHQHSAVDNRARHPTTDNNSEVQLQAFRNFIIDMERGISQLDESAGDGTVNRIRGDECSICLSYSRDDKSCRWSVLPKCNHRFHTDCITVWLAGNKTCPLCRDRGVKYCEVGGINY
ncbi:hypothetical protein M9H77_16633 [Catharanthus roseus]|uniref:Uncharacterized protein n=1 Tax=Catharanthus roseus TaxID=4058 RepID=A0ACC0B2A9_CATRO|nr:hypothetical protein M9H77_16633 [Catharanthus roseus]